MEDRAPLAPAPLTCHLLFLSSCTNPPSTLRVLFLSVLVAPTLLDVSLDRRSCAGTPRVVSSLSTPDSFLDIPILIPQ